MFTLQEARPECADYLPRLPARMLWETDWWDGPMAGVAEVNGERLYFVFADARDPRDDIPEPHYRRFWLVRMSVEDKAYEERAHQRFQACVNTLCDYEDLNGFKRGETRPEKQHRLFYDEYPCGSGPRHMASEVVGWFDW